MAHLRGLDGRRGDDEMSRAQLILVIGFLLAVVFVALAFLLNSVIYTENLATRSESARASHALGVSNDVATGTGNVIGYANEHNTSGASDPSPYADLESELANGVGEMQHLAGRQALASGGVVNLTVVSYNRGTWIDGSGAASNYTTGSGAGDWQLVDDADGVRSVRFHVTNPDKLPNTAPSIGGVSMANFTVVASDGSATWRMELFHDRAGKVDEVSGPGYVVEISDGDGTMHYCRVADSATDFWINVSEGTVGGTDCPGLAFDESLEAVSDVSFENGGSGYGTYRLMVDKPIGSVASAPYNATGSPPPVRRTSIYDATIHVAYETRGVYFDTDRHVAPEADDA